MSWDEDNEWERVWWNCANTYYEEKKQLDTYIPKMGLTIEWDSQGPHIKVDKISHDILVIELKI